MQNYKVEVKNKEEQLEAVDLFIKYGYERRRLNIPSSLHSFVCTDRSGEILISSIDSGEKEITLQELRAMVAPNQKEYLVKTDTGYTLQVLSDVVDGHDGIIEVPEGAEKLIYSKENNNNYHFVNVKNELWCVTTNDTKWYECGITYSGYFNGFGCVVVWQRESLNDQVASAEKARQEQTQCKCSTKELHESELIDAGQEIFDGFTQPEELPFVSDNAWSKQIGGDHYKKLAIQPMEYALQNKLDYAQANVVKYVTRHADKNGKQDLLKAIHNIELMIAHYYSGQE